MSDSRGSCGLANRPYACRALARVILDISKRLSEKANILGFDYMSILSRDCTVRVNEQVLGVVLLLALAVSIVALYEIRKLEKKYHVAQKHGLGDNRTDGYFSMFLSSRLVNSLLQSSL
jgi:hypothetical protein